MRRPLLALLLLFSLPGPVTRGQSAESLERALALTRTGSYREAQRILEQALERGPDGWIATRLGEVLITQGAYARAEAVLTEAAARSGPHTLTARIDLAELLLTTGRRGEGLARCDAFIDDYNTGRARTAADLVAVGRACRALGRTDPQLYRDALRAFDEAAAADPADPEPVRRSADLLLAKYNSREADTGWEDLLARDPYDPEALLGRARRRRFDGEPGVLEAVTAALEVNPALVPAHLFLAGLHLETEQWALARSEVERALEVNPVSVEALALLGAIDYLTDERAACEEARARALAVDPLAATFDRTLAEQCGLVRRYGEAVSFARAAVARDSTDWAAWGALGINLLRTGVIEEGRRSLVRAFTGDPYDVWTKNTLDLLDTMSGWTSEWSGGMVAVLDPKEAGAMAPYLLPLAEEACTTLARRYGYQPPVPLRIEVFPNHADFSVRTVGLVGLGALGVCFGPVVAMDGPGAGPAGPFNWGTTLWHELTHTVTLGTTDHRIPRWFSEGLSVREERRARPGWGSEIDLAFLRRLAAGELRGIGELNDGFIRPRYDGEVLVAYFQASMVCEWIEATRGFEVILEMLRAYREGADTAGVLREVLATTPARFDADLTAWLGERFASSLAALRPEDASPEGGGIALPRYEERAAADPGDFVAHLIVGRTRLAEGQYEEAEGLLQRARTLLPEYTEEDGAYPALAGLYRATGDPVREREVLEAYLERNEDDAPARQRLATLLEEAGLDEAALARLEEAVYIDPLDPDLHLRLAGHFEGALRWPEAVRERRIVVALGPADPTEAWFRLALAQEGAGDRAGARRSVLRALERAPEYTEALDLLVRLQPPPAGAGGGEEGGP